MAQIKLSKDELKKLIDDSKDTLIYYDKKWRYPKQGDCQGSCPMLDAMFHIEYRSGTIIFVPDEPNKYGQEGNTKRNEEE